MVIALDAWFDRGILTLLLGRDAAPTSPFVVVSTGAEPVVSSSSGFGVEDLARDFTVRPPLGAWSRPEVLVAASACWTPPRDAVGRRGLLLPLPLLLRLCAD